jgi:glycosyltransferase involved in cell wall biosynthesis
MNNLESQLPTISIIFPVRNRDKWLSTFLDCIYNLSYPKDKIDILTTVNDSVDDSEKILRQFKQSYDSEYNKILINKYDLGTPTYDCNRFSYIAPKIIQHRGIKRIVPDNITHSKVYRNLAKHRNSLMHRANTDYVFSCDTDIAFPTDTLTKLLNHNTHYISAFICNGHIMHKKNNVDPYQYTNAMYYNEELGIHKHYDFLETKDVVTCSNSGAIFLISKEAYKSGAKYSEHKIGEDFPFSQDLINRGFTLYCDTNLKCSHLMDLELLEAYKSGEWKY